VCKDALESYNVISWLDGCDALTNRLNDSSSLMTQHDGESSLGVLAGKCVCICVADSRVMDFDADFVGSGRGYFDGLDAEVFSCFPCNCRLCLINIAA
jgi:hypothetical protein